MPSRRGFLLGFGLCGAVAVLGGTRTIAQTHGEPEEFTAVAIVNNNPRSR